MSFEGAETKGSPIEMNQNMVTAVASENKCVLDEEVWQNRKIPKGRGGSSKGNS